MEYELTRCRIDIESRILCFHYEALMGLESSSRSTSVSNYQSSQWSTRFVIPTSTSQGCVRLVILVSKKGAVSSGDARKALFKYKIYLGLGIDKRRLKELKKKIKRRIMDLAGIFIDHKAGRELLLHRGTVCRNIKKPDDLLSTFFVQTQMQMCI